ncbi:MAG: hypothetical protein H0V53_00765 [Rubrobacter sp.]|nr:hypothetical protein [Rubrobacter sp.]
MPLVESGGAPPRETLPVKRAVLALFILAHTAILFLMPRTPAFQVEIFRGYADRIFAGEVPYADFAYEYPPLSLLTLLLPRAFTGDPEAYASLFGAEMLVFNIVILVALYRIGLKAVVLYGVAMLLFWRLPYIRHDLVPVAAATLGTVALLRGRALLSAVLWGAGGALKLYPMVAVPTLACGAGLLETARRWTVAGAVFGAGIAWGFVAFGPDVVYLFDYHADRPAMIESTPANIQLLLPGSDVVLAFGSYNVIGPFGNPLVGLFDVLQLAAVAVALAVCLWQGRSAPPGVGVARGAAAATFAFAVFGKVLSPHFLFWPLPLLAIATALRGLRMPRATWALFFAAIALTTAMNEQYHTIQEDLPYFTAMLTARNLLLIPLFALMLLRPKEGEGDQQEKPPGERGVE